MPAMIVNEIRPSSNGQRWWCETELSLTYDNVYEVCTAKLRSNRTHNYLSCLSAGWL
jgi:hypothetical protein